MIIYKMKKDGGFMAGDTKTGRTSYAYPTSISASNAKRKPLETATEMMSRENKLHIIRHVDFVLVDKERISEMLEAKK